MLSPLLFNYYMSKMPIPTEANHILATYADDISLLATGPNVVELTQGINDYLARVQCWLDEHNLQSNDKSTYTIFTTWTKEINQELNIEMNNTKIPLDKNPKILGNIFELSTSLISIALYKDSLIPIKDSCKTSQASYINRELF